MFSKETRTNTHNLQVQKLFILMVEGRRGSIQLFIGKQEPKTCNIH